jgi:small subunit ribosomal protein S7
MQVVGKTRRHEQGEVLVRNCEQLAHSGVPLTTRISYGGMAYPRSVDVSPQRRIDLALRYLSVGAVRSAHKNAKSFEECLVDELLLAYKKDTGSFAIARKEERERVARSAR